MAGVSMTTVSHALSAKRPVSPETASRIQAAIEELGYVPSSAARMLQAGRTLMIGLVVPDVSDPFFGSLAVGVEQAADESGYGVVLSSSSHASERHARYFDLLRSRTIDGLIYVAGDAGRDPQLAELARSFPVVLADEWVAGFDRIPLIAADHRMGGRLVGEHLRALGHRVVSVVSGPPGLRSADDRMAGFREIFPQAAVIAGDFTEETAARATGEHLASRAEPPTAIFAVNDLSALGAIDALLAAGLSVPGQVSVAGFDDVAFARRLQPPLTTVHQPIDEIGGLATRTLIELIGGAAPVSPPPRPVELVVRESTAPPRP